MSLEKVLTEASEEGFDHTTYNNTATTPSTETKCVCIWFHVDIERVYVNICICQVKIP